MRACDIPLRALGPEALLRTSGTPVLGRVLCLHALGLSRHAFDDIRNLLDPGWAVYSYDLRGHGALRGQANFTLEDLVDDACRVIDLMDGPVHVLGHALGSVVAVMACARRPLVPSLAVLNPVTLGLPAFAARAVEAERDGLENMLEPALRRWFNGDGSADRPEQAYARASLCSMDANAYGSGWRALASFGGYADLAQHLPPTLCLAAEDDVSTPPSSMQRMLQAYADVGRAPLLDFRLNARGAHMLPLCEPGWVAAEATRHWTRNEIGVQK